MADRITACLESDLGETIPTAYALVAPPVIERFSLVDLLRTGGEV